MRPKHILLLAVLLLAACSPLRRIQRNQKADSLALDRSEIQKAVTEALRESGTLTQTIVEFHPPEPELPLEERPNVPRPAVKRIIRTEITAQREQTTQTDSLARNDLHTEVQRELSDKVAEKPPASTQTVKWTAIALAAAAILFLTLKFARKS